MSKKLGRLILVSALTGLSLSAYGGAAYGDGGPPHGTVAEAPPGVTYDSQVANDDIWGRAWVAVDVNDPRHVAVAHGQAIGVSDNGGVTWRQVMENPDTTTCPPSQDCGNPMIVADADGNFYFARLTSYQFHVSRDHGATWEPLSTPLHLPPVIGSYQFGGTPGDMTVNLTDGPLYMGPSLAGCDGTFSAVDLSTGALVASCANHGDQGGGMSGPDWAAWFAACRANFANTQGLDRCGRRYVSVSHDHGNTWSPWRPEDSADYPGGHGGWGGIPVAAHGVLATAYIGSSAPGSECSPCAIFATSTDDGQTWSRHVVPGATPQIQTLTPANAVPTLTGDVEGDNPAGWAANVLGNDNHSVALQPFPAADPSRVGRYAIMVFDATRTQLLVYQTQDSGNTWSGPAVLGDGVHRIDKPAFAYGPTGALGVMWKSVYAEDLSFDVLAAVAPAGDLRFGQPVRLNSQRSHKQLCLTSGNGDQGDAKLCDELSWMVMDAAHLNGTWRANIGGQDQNRMFGRYDFAADPQFKKRSSAQSGTASIGSSAEVG